MLISKRHLFKREIHVLCNICFIIYSRHIPPKPTFMYSIISGLKISWLISSSQSSSLTSKSLTSATRVRRMAPFWTRSMSTVIAWSQISPVFPFNECFWGFYLVLYRMNLSLFVFKADVGISSVFLKLR